MLSPITGDKITLILPKRTNLFAMVLLIPWTIGVIGAIGITVYGQIADHRYISELTFIVVFFMLPAAIIAIRMILWNIKGKEVVTFDATMMIIKKEGIFLTFPRKYEVSLIGGFDVGEEPRITFGNVYGFTGARVLFTYWEQTKGFGQSLSEKEATEIVRLLNDRLKSYR